jgi:hypothetical protein
MYARIRAKTSVANGTGQGKGEGGHRKSDPWATGRPFITCQSNKEHCRLSLGWWFKLNCAHNRWSKHSQSSDVLTIGAQRAAESCTSSRCNQ